ncbi:hypothetical protein N7510_006338 [Penicillium lagena]|uniref:uncharacterized protein n=1 Tax=Penicillium lagena TaxID=94218 RepID=UPI00253FA3D1|nr:uncharacterized protein N7510_006338 [Penicillium lagena]KAJ5613144.1 hypothetical protein N7510_006338 [Penicillium lagena]
MNKYALATEYVFSPVVRFGQNRDTAAKLFNRIPTNAIIGGAVCCTASIRFGLRRLGRDPPAIHLTRGRHILRHILRHSGNGHPELQHVSCASI